VIASGDGAKKRDGQVWERKERHSASCRVENDCERDWQQPSTTNIHHLALSTTLLQQLRISLLNHCAQHEARPVRPLPAVASQSASSSCRNKANTTSGF